MDNKKVIVCDLDGTLTESRAPLSPDMAEVISHVLNRHFFVVVSGAAFHQFQKQFLQYLSCTPEQFQNLYLFPTNGSTCYVYNDGEWKQKYNEPLSEKERQDIISALYEAIEQTGVDVSNPYGEVIEDRGSQVTFSGRGQDAPVEVKKKWDPEHKKRKAIVAIIKKKLPQFEIHDNATSSIDVTHKGIDKAYAIGKIKELLHAKDEDIIFVGDALQSGGNDSPVTNTGVDYIQEEGPTETIEFLSRYM